MGHGGFRVTAPFLIIVVVCVLLAFVFIRMHNKLVRLRQLFALTESYPDLKANTNFNQLQAELGETETRISKARRFYNANVRELNTAVEMFPSSIIAGMGSFKAAEYFEIEDDAARPGSSQVLKASPKKARLKFQARLFEYALGNQIG